MRAVSSAIVLFSALAALASPHSDRRDHAGLAKRMDGQLEKRQVYSNARFTWYPTDTGPDACTGKNHQDSDWYVALNKPLFGDSGNGHCLKKIRITAKGKTAVATIVDSCPTCPSESDIDMTKGLYQYFDPVLGEFYGSWEFVDGSDSGSGDGDSQPPTTHHTTTTKATPKPPTTHYTPTTTSHYTPKTTPTTSTTTTSDQSSSSVTHSNSSSTTSTISSSSTSSTVIPTTTNTPTTSLTDVANAGSNPSTTSVGGVIQGGISNNVGQDSGGIKLAFSKAALGLTALALVAVHGL